MNLTRKQINTMLKSDSIVFRHKNNKGIIECNVIEDYGCNFETILIIELESSVPYGYGINEACHVQFFYKGEYKSFNNLLFFLKSLTKKNNVKLIWDLNGHRTDEHRKHGFITETLSLENNGLYCEIRTYVKQDNWLLIC